MCCQSGAEYVYAYINNILFSHNFCKATNLDVQTFQIYATVIYDSRNLT